MTIGEPTVFALEFRILHAHERLGFRALGSFLIHLDGQIYGVDEPDASMLACSLDEVASRIRERGAHVTSFSREPNPGKIADAYRDVVYNENPHDTYFDMTVENCSRAFDLGRICWAPDSDEAFDDGSYLLQFDIEDRVRLIGFRCGPDGRHDPNTLRDVSMGSDDFYTVLQSWHDAFLKEWTTLPKIEE